MSRGKFRLNRKDGKIMGVCAGLSDHFDIDVTLVRVAMVLALVLTFPVAGFAYLVMGLVADGGGTSRHFEMGGHAPRLSAHSVEETRARMRDLDARMQAIETHVTSSNVALAKEIDELR
ncbi:MAG: PspC domain-containing protein [Allosphingosinicella sp.]|uniref:PspC domain-containing protein n=1 Tax=Allosphingosinicella sp. TaxID=2823234 RepID=UPI003934AD59